MSSGRSAAAAAAAVGAILGRWRAPGRGNRSGRSYACVLLTPIRAGSEADLAAYLRDLPSGVEGSSPLARLQSVHFGRWMIIDQLRMSWVGGPRRPTSLKSQYLLFTAAVTAPDSAYADDLPESFLREIAALIPNEADAIWGSCVDYPGSASPDAFVRYLRSSQLDTLLFHVGYPDTTVQQVRQALAGRDGLVGFARDHQYEVDPVRLQRSYLEESATWFP